MRIVGHSIDRADLPGAALSAAVFSILFGIAAAVSAQTTAIAATPAAPPSPASAADSSYDWERVGNATAAPSSASESASEDAGQGTYTPPSQALPPSTTEIPQAMSGNGTQSGSSSANGETVNYEATQNPRLIEPQLRSLQEFIAEGENTSPLGLELRQARRQLDDGEQADGLLVMRVIKDSPAAKAGVHGYRQATHAVLEGAAVAASLFFPPAVLALPILDQVHVGESYDMIIGVDGWRVTNFMDFQDRMRDVQPGDVVYLSIVRNGKRVQMPVKIPKLSTAASSLPY